MAPFAAMDGKPATKPLRLSLGTSEIYRSESPSSSPSSSRHKRNSSNPYDLLRDLSPTTTLRAFTAASSSSAGNSSDQLVRSIESASSSERIYGARIAQTCKDIRAWHEEVQKWEWPGTFEEPAEADKTAKRRRMLQEHFSIPPSDGSPDGLYFGCLPQEIVSSCEKRVEEIRDAVEELDVEDLKNHVLNAHTVTQDDYANSNSTPQRLDDFTALITATILQALPFLSRLNRLLNTWSVRLCVLRKVPAYLRELQEVKQEVEGGWSSMTRDIQNSQIDGDTLRSIYDTLHNRLGKRVFRLGARLDSVLDDLEGREETLPEHWIDAFETLETDYGEWVVQTERELMSRHLNMMERARPKPTLSNPTPIGPSGDQRPIASVVQSETGIPNSFPPPESAIGLGVILNGHDYGLPKTTTEVSRANSKETLSPDDKFSAPLELAESPVLGNSNATQFRDEDEESTDSEDEPPLPSEQIHDQKSARRSVPPLPEVDLSRSSSIQRDRPLDSSSASTSSAPSPLRPRHVPIVIPDFEQKEAVSHLPTRSASSNRASSSGDLTKGPAINNVRARAAFLNRGLEQTQTLQKSVNSPVRPFEHASQAFTKLFARANSAQYSAQHSRSSSASSRGSSSLRKSFSTKRDLGYTLDASTTLTASLQPVKVTPSPVELDANPVSDPRPSAQNHHSVNSSSVAELPTRDASVTAEENLVSGDDPSSRNQHLRNLSAGAELPARDAFVTPDTNYGFEPSTVGSRSTIESAWNSPAFSDLPENWPLIGRLPNGDEISSPQKPIEADCFEKMFVDSLPASPQAPRSGVLGEYPVMTDIARKYDRLHSKQNSLDAGLSMQDVSGASQHHQRSGSRHVPIIPEGRLLVDMETLPEATTPGSLPSNLSTPEVYSASAAGYFKSKEVTTPPPLVTRTSSASTTKHSNDNRDHHSKKVESQPAPRRASVASIENHPRSELRTIEISDAARSSSFSSAHSTTSPVRSTPSPEAVRIQAQRSLAPSPRSKMMAKLTSGSNPPLNFAMPKRRQVVDLGVTDSPLSGSESSVSQASTRKKKGHKRVSSTAEQLDRHVSRVLSSLPNRIRFTPAESDIPITPETTKGSLRSRASMSFSASRRPSLILTPAHTEDKPKKSKSASDSEVKLYHLSQEGARQPIKLYVRLVGDGERVMVRVGGGWADLGEYLRQYADHHGHRTFSDGNIKVAGVAKDAKSTGLKARTPLSRPGSVLERPTSRLSQRRRSSFGVNPGSVGRSDSPAFLMNMESFKESRDLTETPSRPGTANQSSSSMGTPTSPSTKSTSRPSTGDAAYMSTSPAASWTGNDIGLAGPASRKHGRELDSDKAKWVEEMIGRAKQASVEKKKMDEKKEAWADIGKIGGTRRMIFKHQTHPSQGQKD